MPKTAGLRKGATVTILGREPMVVIPLSLWRRVEDLLENHEALASRRFLRRVQKARSDAAQGRLVRPFA